MAESAELNENIEMQIWFTAPRKALSVPIFPDASQGSFLNDCYLTDESLSWQLQCKRCSHSGPPFKVVLFIDRSSRSAIPYVRAPRDVGPERTERKFKIGKEKEKRTRAKFAHVRFSLPILNSSFLTRDANLQFWM